MFIKFCNGKNSNPFADNNCDNALNTEIFVSSNICGSNSALITNIKNAIINGLYPSFGYNTSITRSQIVQIIQSVSGVANCVLQLPSIDIEYKYDIYTSLSQQQILEYSPELVYTSVDSITIELRT